MPICGRLACDGLALQRLSSWPESVHLLCVQLLKPSSALVLQKL